MQLVKYINAAGMLKYYNISIFKNSFTRNCSQRSTERQKIILNSYLRTAKTPRTTSTAIFYFLKYFFVGTVLQAKGRTKENEKPVKK